MGVGPTIHVSLPEATTCTVVHNLLPMRLLSDPRSEMVSQALFGETVIVLEMQGDYSLVRTADNYEGWGLTAHLAPMPPESYLENEL